MSKLDGEHELPPGVDPSRIVASGYGHPPEDTFWPIQPLFGLRLLIEPHVEACCRCGLTLELMPGHHYTDMADAGRGVVCENCREAMLSESAA